MSLRDPKTQHRLDVYAAHYKFERAAWGVGIALVGLGFILGLVATNWNEYYTFSWLLVTASIPTYQYARALPEMLRTRVRLELQFQHTYGHPVTYDLILSPVIDTIKAYWKRAPRHRQ